MPDWRRFRSGPEPERLGASASSAPLMTRPLRELCPQPGRRFGPARLLAIAALALTGCTIVHNPAPSSRPAVVRLDPADPVLAQRRIFVVGDLTNLSAEETIRQLLVLDARSPEPIDLYLMTPGGDLKAAFAIVHVFETMRSLVNTWALGECNSGGAMLLAAGTGERRAFEDSTVLVHGMEYHGRPPAKYTESTQAAYTAFWRRRARLPEAWLPLPPGKLFVLTASEALEYGVIDRVLPRESRGPKPEPAAR